MNEKKKLKQLNRKQINQNNLTKRVNKVVTYFSKENGQMTGKH